MKTKNTAKHDKTALTSHRETDVGDDPVTTAMHVQARAMERSADFALEWFDFFTARVQQDIVTMQRLGKCRSIEETFATLSDFQKQALEDYTVATARLSMESTLATDDMAEDVAEESVAVMRSARQLAA